MDIFRHGDETGEVRVRARHNGFFYSEKTEFTAQVAQAEVQIAR